MDNDHLAGGSGKERDRRVKHLPWIGPRHRTTAKSLLAAYQSVHKKLLPEMLRAIAFPIRLEASGGGNASEGGKKGQVVGTLLETNRTISCIGKGLERLVARRALLGGDTLWSNQPQHGGALPKRSAVDLVASFVYDAETAFAQSKEEAAGTDEEARLAHEAASANRLFPGGSQG
ncbi:hypothetical protein DID88_003031 [Monilinia fructigena]|uniref:Uncharacterized protein n=1 Tax=Monilinia fructigena TaxID=38457 RepID=A0A395IED5_9HELO|nr:hypothetical protein DID88_003031 [Monilinia fructigena]